MKKYESFINILKGNPREKDFRGIYISKRVWDLGIVREAEIYYCTAGKDRRPALERLTCNTIDISERLESEFCDLV